MTCLDEKKIRSMDFQEGRILILMKFLDSSFNRLGQICLGDLVEMALEDKLSLFPSGEARVWGSCKEGISLKRCLPSTRGQGDEM